MKHGTTTRYRRGCRCTECRQAKSLSNRLYKARRKTHTPHTPRTPRPGSKAEHGSVSRYRRGCRCDICRAAKREADRRYRLEGASTEQPVDAAPYKVMIDELIAFGLSKSGIAKAYGYNRNVRRGGFKLNCYYEQRIKPQTAKKIGRLHWAAWMYRGDFREICKCEIPEEVRRQVFEEAG